MNQGEPPHARPKSEAVDHGSMVVPPKSTVVRRCFLCNSLGHLVVNCPKRTSGKQAKLGSSTPRTSTNACMVDPVFSGNVSAEDKLHNDTNCEPRYEPSHSSNVFNDMRNVSSAVDLEQSLLSNNACQMPKNELISITDAVSYTHLTLPTIYSV